MPTAVMIPEMISVGLGPMRRMIQPVGMATMIAVQAMAFMRKPKAAPGSRVICPGMTQLATIQGMRRLATPGKANHAMGMAMEMSQVAKRATHA